MIANLNTEDAISINSGHLPMLGKPKELAKAINNFADKISQT